MEECRAKIDALQQEHEAKLKVLQRECDDAENHHSHMAGVLNQEQYKLRQATTRYGNVRNNYHTSSQDKICWNSLQKAPSEQLPFAVLDALTVCVCVFCLLTLKGMQS